MRHLEWTSWPEVPTCLSTRMVTGEKVDQRLDGLEVFEKMWRKYFFLL